MKLKPCPFCGSPAEEKRSAGTTTITCMTGKCQVNAYTEHAVALIAINRWNTRFVPPTKPTNNHGGKMKLFILALAIIAFTFSAGAGMRKHFRKPRIGRVTIADSSSLLPAPGSELDAVITVPEEAPLTGGPFPWRSIMLERGNYTIEASAGVWWLVLPPGVSATSQLLTTGTPVQVFVSVPSTIIAQPR
jgi:hypothetical protein